MSIKNLPSALCFLLLNSFMAPGTAQVDYNLTELSNPLNVCTTRFNDVWGFKHTNGTEYAVLGTYCGTSIYDLSDPGLPTLVADIPGAPSIWRDMKNWGDHIYVVADQGSLGIQVIDLSDTSEVQYWNYNPIVETDTLWTAHNLYIDQLGFMYVAGSQLNGPGGVVIFNPKLDDSLPPMVGFGPAVYAHDVYVNETRNLMVTSDIYDGSFTLHSLDRDEMNVVVTTLSSQETVLKFTHNAWTTTDGNIVFTTDEISGAFVEAWDISNTDDILLLDRYAPSSLNGANTTPHNVHVKGNHLVISYYRAGLKIVDASRPGNLVEVASFDTQRGNGSGCWGAFPFFESALVLASDITNGLFVLQPDYGVKAAYLEGQVEDEMGNAIDSALIFIGTLDSTFEFSKKGAYAAGIVDQTSFSAQTGRSGSNTLQVHVSKAGFDPIDTMITFIPDSVIMQNFILKAASLPVELISFSVASNACENKISWQVGSEINHSHFNLERSSDGVHFINLKSVFPTEAKGSNYEYQDLNPDKVTYYRLHQIDLDGSGTYSKVIIVENKCRGSQLELSLYPNPVQSYLNIKGPTKIDLLVISDLSGKTFVHFNTLEKIDVSNLPAGVYYLRINADDRVYLKKISKID